MNIGYLHIIWLNRRILRAEIMNAITYDQEYRAIIAKMARSEVKNYLARVAEDAEMPFGSPAGFVRGIRDLLAETACTNVPAHPNDCACTCANCSGCTGGELADDSPFNVIDNSRSVGVALSFKCRMYGDRPHQPCSGTVDDGTESTCECTCHGADFCNATPDLPEETKWPVCSRSRHDDDKHESADYWWTNGRPAVLKQPLT